MNQIKIAWQWLDGKKTIVAEIYWGTVMPGLAVFYPDGVPANTNKWVVLAGFLLTSIGLGHKMIKQKSGNE
jgi:hypothetical protein